MATGGAIPVVIAIENYNTDYPLNDALGYFQRLVSQPTSSDF